MEPIYIKTFFIQRVKKSVPTELDNDADGGFFGYKLLPGAIVEVLIYNSTDERLVKMGKFFSPEQGPDLVLARLLEKPRATTDNDDGPLDIVKLQFVNDDNVTFFDKTCGMIDGAPHVFVPSEKSYL